MSWEPTPIHRPPPGGEYYVFRDSVHNLIEIEDADEGLYIRRLLMTRELQRLRFVRQNGVSFLVYPSLEVSRFPHALGSFHVARRLIASLMDRQPYESDGFPDSLRITPPDCFAFSIAALVHDIGHGPLSHVWEEIWAEPRGMLHFHESMGSRILTSSSTEIGKYLGNPDAFSKLPKLGEDVLSFVTRKHRLSYLLPLLAGNLDVDRLDFIARDTRGAGVTYGFHDLEWIIRSLRFARLPGHKTDGEGPQWIVAIDGRKGLSTLVQFLHARENMYRLVYHHKTTRVTTKMLELLLRRATLLGKDVEFPSSILKEALTETELDVSKFVQLDDSDIWMSIKAWSQYNGDPLLKELASCLLSRRFYKAFLLEEHVYERLRSIDTPASGDIIKNVVAARANCSQTDATFYYGFDTTSFDVVGKESSTWKENVWILESGTLGFEFRTLREYWKKEVGTISSRKQYLLVVHPELVEDIAAIVGRFSFSSPGKDKPGKSATPPKPYGILGSLSDSGAWKEVFAGVNTQHGNEPESTVAIKRYKRPEAGADALERDVKAINLLGASHENLGKAKALSENGEIWIIEQPLWTASLQDLLDKQGPRRDLLEIFDISAQLFGGLTELHRLKLRHTDIKPDNCGIVFKGSERQYVLGDFGCLSSRPQEFPDQVSLLGTLRTRAPETIQHKAIGMPSDVWAMGATIYALCVNRYPFMDISVPHEAVEVRAKREEELRENLAAELAKFEEAARSNLPPFLHRCLGAAFLPANERSSAAGMRQAFKRGKRRLEGKSDVRMAWQRTEDVILTSRRHKTQGPQLSEEVKKLLDSYTDFVPPNMIEELRALFPK